MVDSISAEQRSRNMSRIRSRDTAPERLVRSLLHKAGFRFSLHRKELPGKPDIVLRKHRAVIFVHGCFWHQHKGCAKAKVPKSNIDYWKPKLEGNVTRDRDKRREITSLGWRVLVVWECEVKTGEQLSQKLKRFLEQES